MKYNKKRMDLAWDGVNVEISLMLILAGSLVLTLGFVMALLSWNIYYGG